MKFFTTLVLSLMVIPLSAQYTRTNYYEIFFGPGMFVAFTDIGTYNTGFGADLGLRYRFDSHFSLRANLVSGYLSGTDEGSKNDSRGIIYQTLLIEPTAQIEFFLFRERRGFDRRGHLVLKPVINPYAFAGAGGIYYYPSVEGGNPDMITDDYSKFAPVFNGGGGLIFTINKKWSCGIEMGGRFILTDYLDGYTSDASTSRDMFYCATVNINYRFIPVPIRNR
jgi:hypothetical protein